MVFYNVVFVLGRPGAGKGTVCRKLKEKLGFVHFSVGDLVREESKREGSEVGRLMEESFKKGIWLPFEIIFKVLKNAMEAVGDSKLFLIDGFPRNQDPS